MELFYGHGFAGAYEITQGASLESRFVIQTNRQKQEADLDKYNYALAAFNTLVSETEVYTLFGISKEENKYISIREIFADSE